MIKLKNILNEEPLNEGPSTEEKRIAMLAVRKQAKYRNVDMASAIIAGIPTLIVYVLAGKYFIRGLTSGAVKG